MPGKPDTDDWRVERGEQVQFLSSIYSQPWWRGAGENASKSSSADQLNGSAMNGVTVTQSETNEGMADDGVDFNKQRQPMVSPSLSGVDKPGDCILASH